MKNLLKCSSLIRGAFILAVITLIASQMTDALAHGKRRGIHSKLDEILAEVQKPPAGIPKTGQTDFSESGDDGDLERGVTWPNPRFKDNLDGTITDNLTHLIWDQDAARFGPSSWDNALSDCNGLDGGAVGDGSSAGDWRLPNRLELASLLHLGFVSPAVPNTAGTGKWTTNGDPFNDVQSEYYWSSTADAFVTDSRWFVSMNGGTVDGRARDNTSDTFYVWCVKGGN